MENGLNYGAVGFAMSVVKRFLIDEKQSNVLNEADLYNTLHVLARIATQSPNPPEGSVSLLHVFNGFMKGLGLGLGLGLWLVHSMY